MPAKAHPEEINAERSPTRPLTGFLTSAGYNRAEAAVMRRVLIALIATFFGTAVADTEHVSSPRAPPGDRLLSSQNR